MSKIDSSVQVGVALMAILLCSPATGVAGELFLDASHWGTVDSNGNSTRDADYKTGLSGAVGGVGGVVTRA